MIDLPTSDATALLDEWHRLRENAPDADVRFADVLARRPVVPRTGPILTAWDAIRQREAAVAAREEAFARAVDDALVAFDAGKTRADVRAVLVGAVRR
jgi:hypothetical protein